MFDVAPTELLLVGAVALIVIGPKDLPATMRTVGRWVGKARGVASHFRSGFDQMVREAELEEMEKRWAEENKRIMREHPPEPLDAPAEPYVETPPASVMASEPAMEGAPSPDDNDDAPRPAPSVAPPLR